MAAFDPNAATAAYLDQLSPALRQAARVQTDQAHWLAAVGGVLAILICWLILRTGVLARLRSRIERLQPRPWLVSLAGAAAFLGLFALLWMPWSAFTAWREGQPVIDHVAGALSATLAPLLSASILVTLLYALKRRAPRNWWAWAGGAAAGLVIATVWLPYALAAGPAQLPAVPPGAAREGLMALIRDAGLPAHQVYVGSGPDADVTGTPFEARVVVGEDMLARSSPAEVRAAVGHLAGHFHNGDQLSLAIVLSLLIIGGLYALHRLFGPVSRLMGLRDLQGPDDPAGLPVQAAVAIAWLALASMAFNNFDRLVNVRADQFALDHAREPDGQAEALVRGWRGDKVDPAPLEEAVFYDHPSLRNRVLHAVTWKAAQRP